MLLSAPLLCAVLWSAGPEPVLRLHDQQDGSTHMLKIGARATVELTSAADSGLRWELLEPPISVVLRQVGGVEVAQASNKQGGAWRIQRWTFEASGAGGQRLRFEQRRPGEVKRESERYLSFVIEVENRKGRP